jgi:hypothetical protein
MSKIKLVTFIVVFIASFAWSLVGHSISGWLYVNLVNLGCPLAIVQIVLFFLPLVLLVEILTKVLLLRSVSPMKFTPTQAEEWQHLNLEELALYTSELEQLGFVQLMDYTVMPSSHPLVARLFAHPEKYYFAEVGKVGDLPMSCSIACRLENQWSLGVVDRTFTPMLSAISYAFLRQPRSLVKTFDRVSVTSLLQSLLNWQAEVSSSLDSAVIRDIQAETYFESVQLKRTAQRRTMLCKSVTWSLLEMFWVLLHPRSEWLGDYRRSKSNS